MKIQCSIDEWDLLNQLLRRANIERVIQYDNLGKFNCKLTEKEPNYCHFNEILEIEGEFN